MGVHSSRIEDLEFPFLAVVSTPLLYELLNESVLPSVGVLAVQKSFLGGGSPCDEHRQIKQLGFYYDNDNINIPA